MDPTDDAAAYICQETHNRLRENIAILILTSGVLLLSQTPWIIAHFVWNMKPLPWLLIGHLLLGIGILVFIFFSPQPQEEIFHIPEPIFLKLITSFRDSLLEIGMIFLILLLGGLLPLIAFIGGCLGILQYVAGRLLLKPAMVPTSLRIRLRDNTLTSKEHLPSHVRLMIISQPGFRFNFLRRLAAWGDGILHIGPWGTALSIRGWILLSHGISSLKT